MHLPNLHRPAVQERWIFKVYHQKNILVWYCTGLPLWSRRQHAWLSSSKPEFDPRPGQISWVRFFRGISSSVRQMSGSFRPPWFLEYHLAIIIILIISALLEWMSEWMVCIVFNVRVVSEVAPALSWSLIRGSSPCPCVIKKVLCDPKLIPSPDRAWLCKAREAWVT